jgi:hypothetical protein
MGTSCTFIVLNEDEGGPYPLVPPEEAGPSEAGVSEASTPDATVAEEAGNPSTSTSSGGTATPDASSSEADAALSHGTSGGASGSSSGGCSAGASTGAGWDFALALLGSCIVLVRRRRKPMRRMALCKQNWRSRQ